MPSPNRLLRFRLMNSLHPPGILCRFCWTAVGRCSIKSSLPHSTTRTQFPFFHSTHRLIARCRLCRLIRSHPFCGWPSPLPRHRIKRPPEDPWDTFSFHSTYLLEAQRVKESTLEPPATTIHHRRISNMTTRSERKQQHE